MASLHVHVQSTKASKCKCWIDLQALARAQLDSTKLLSAPSLALTEEKSKQQ